MPSQVTGTPEAFNPSPYSYSQSTSPKIDSISIAKDNNPIRVFDEAIDTLSEKLAEAGGHINALQRELTNRNNEIMHKTGMLSRLQDADAAAEMASLVKDSILRQGGAFAIQASGNLHAERVNALLQYI